MTIIPKQEIQRKYNHYAPRYDLIVSVPELLGVKKLRRKIIRKASGKVLEVAVGTGKNLKYYPHTCQITAVDFSSNMLEIARNRANHSISNITFLLMDGEALSFPDRSFDTVVSSLTLCTFQDPVAALREMGRVCRIDGRIFLIEHGRSNREWLGRWQDRRADEHAKTFGCHWNREPIELIHRAGLSLISDHRYFLGILHAIEASPLQKNYEIPYHQ